MDSKNYEELYEEVIKLKQRLTHDEKMVTEGFKKVNQSLLELAQLFQQLVEKLKKKGNTAK